MKKQARILLADDNPDILDLLKVVLEPEHQVVGAVVDGTALLTTAQDLQPDVIITDIEMPVMSGLDAAPLLKDIAPDCKIIFLTAYNDPSDIAAAFAAGAAGYLVKGVTPNLFTSLRSMITGIMSVRTRSRSFFSEGAHRRQAGRPKQTRSLL